MEESSHASVFSKINELRSDFKKCFKDPMFSLVPFEIWRDLIISNGDAKTISRLSQACHAFKEIVDNIGEKNFNLALMLRREGQIDPRKYLLLCAENNNSFAMFHLGYAYLNFGWGLQGDVVKGVELLKKSSELGNAHAMAYFSNSLLAGVGVSMNRELSNVWAKKALSSNNSFAVGYCHCFGLGTVKDNEKGFSYFEESANEGDEFGQLFLGQCFCYGLETQIIHKKAFDWLLKSAEQGNSEGQFLVGRMFRVGEGCEKDEQKFVFWLKKAAKQGHKNSKMALKGMGIEME